MYYIQRSIQTNALSHTQSDIPGYDVAVALSDIALNIMSKPLIYLVRKQYFPLFTGGENINECIKMAQKYSDNNIGLIIDNSTEEGTEKEVFERNMAAKRELVDVSADNLGKTVVFMAVKMTALSSPTLLEQMTQILDDKQPSDMDPKPFMNESQIEELEATIDSLTELCQYAKSKGIGVWLDAEQYSRQTAMNYVSRRLMQNVNTPNGSERIWLFQTYQCYLQKSAEWIAFDVEHAKKNGYRCGVKLVRGAYMDYEIDSAQKENKSNPIHQSKVCVSLNMNFPDFSSFCYYRKQPMHRMMMLFDML